MPRYRSIPRRTAQCRVRFCRVMGVAVAVVENEAAETLRAPRAPGPADGGPPARGDGGLYRRMRWIFAIAALLVVALVVSLVVRPIGAYFTPVDGWGVDALELTMGALCIARYFEGSWRSSSPVARLFPLVIGRGLPRLGTRRRRHHHRVVGRRHSLGALGRRRVLRVLLPSVLRELRLAHPPWQQELPGRNLAGRTDRLSRRGRRVRRLRRCGGDQGHRRRHAGRGDGPGLSAGRHPAARPRRRRLRRAPPWVPTLLRHRRCRPCRERDRGRVQPAPAHEPVRLRRQRCGVADLADAAGHRGLDPAGPHRAPRHRPDRWVRNCRPSAPPSAW